VILPERPQPPPPPPRRFEEGVMVKNNTGGNVFYESSLYPLARSTWEPIDNEARREAERRGRPPPPAHPPYLPPYPPLGGVLVDHVTLPRRKEMNKFMDVLPAHTGCFTSVQTSIPDPVTQVPLLHEAKHNPGRWAQIIKDTREKNAISMYKHKCIFQTADCGNKGGKGRFSGRKITGGMLGRCAVVGNSELLLQRHRGDEIDRSDTVIRIGHQIKGNKAQKTTIHVSALAAHLQSKKHKQAPKESQQMLKEWHKYHAEKLPSQVAVTLEADSHPVTPITVGYEMYVGRKTEIMYVAGTGAADIMEAPIDAKRAGEHGRERVADLYVMPHYSMHHYGLDVIDGTPFLAIHPEVQSRTQNLANQFSAAYGGGKASEELQAVTFFLTSGLCRSVSVYGMDDVHRKPYWPGGRGSTVSHPDLVAMHALMKSGQMCIYN